MFGTCPVAGISLEMSVYALWSTYMANMTLLDFILNALLSYGRMILFWFFFFADRILYCSWRTFVANLEHMFKFHELWI